MRFAYTAAAAIILLQAVAATTQAYFSIVEVKISLPIENRMMPWIIIIWLKAIFTIVIGSWILFLLVTIRLVGEFKAVAEREERERIARDLHDTVLQTFQAFVFKTSSMLAKSDSAQSDSLERSLSEAISAIQEGREKVIALRTSKNYAYSLQDNLRLLCEHEAKHYEQKFLLHCVGEMLYEAINYPQRVRIAFRRFGSNRSTQMYEPGHQEAEFASPIEYASNNL